VRSGVIVLSRRFVRDVEEVASFPDEIARTIAATLEQRLAAEERTVSLNRWTSDPRARELYWSGRFHWNRRSNAGLAQAREAYQAAIARDSTFALAFAGLADVKAQTVWTGEDPQRAYAEAEALAERALRLDPDLAEAWATLGLVRLYRDGDWNGAEREFRRALQLNPSYATAYHWYGTLLGARGDFQEALRMLRRAEELDPISAPIRTSTGTVLYYARDYEAAAMHLRRALEIDPEFWQALAHLASASSMRGRHEDAVAEAHQAVALSRGNPLGLAVLGVAYGHAGRREEAARVLAELRRERIAGRPVSPVGEAAIHAALGERRSAIELLRSAVRVRDPMVIMVAVEPMFDPIRSDSSFSALVESVRRGARE
jgi:Flp pilus assembly protein TadD